VPRINLPLVVACLALGIVGPGAPATSFPDDGAPESQAPRFPAGAALVTVDVVVLDDSGEPIEGLRPEDFTVTDEGRLRPLSRFEAVTLPDSPEAEDHEVRFVSSNASASGPALRTFVVVFDDVHMARDTALAAKQAVGSFVEVLRPGDRVSLVPTSGGAWWHARIPEGLGDLMSSLRRLRGLRPRDFSVERMSDYEALRLHLHRDPEVLAQVTRRYVEYRVIFEGEDTTAGGVLSAVPQRVRHELFRDPPHPFISGRAAELYQGALSRKRATYDVLKRVCEGLAGTRGRKSILFISEGFVQEPGLREHRDTVEAAQRANAAFHFLDARGLTGLPATADAQISDAIELPFMSAQLDEAFLESQGGVSLAGDTGGRVIRNTNDLGQGLRRLERESRAYYPLGFEPTDVEDDGSFHRLGVKVDRHGVEVLARKGYYAPSREGDPAPEEGGLGPVLQSAVDSPIDADSIPLRMTSYLLGPMDGKTNALLVANVDPRALALEKKDEVFEGALEVLLVISNRDTGEQVARRHQIALSFPPPVFEQVQRTRLPLMLDLPLGPGRHQARLLVHDLRSGAIGTVRHELEVPMADALRISTPILTDIAVPDSGGGTRPRPVARRTFVGDRTIALAYQVHGAETGLESSARVVAGFRVESASGTVVAGSADAELAPGPDGALSQMAAIDLTAIPPGLYALVVSARDEVAGAVVETHLPFRVAPRPGTVMVEEAGGDEALERVRGYILEYGGGERE
jgi:VWFA-related protein